MPVTTDYLLQFAATCLPQPGHLLPWLFPKLLGSVYCLAFTSLFVQAAGLYSSLGVLPIRQYLTLLKREFNGRAYRFCPTLFWFNSSDHAVSTGALAGIIISLLVIAGVSPTPLLMLLWLLYLSYVVAGQEFLSYQWDALLLEAGFMTIFMPLTTPAPPLVVFTYRFFLFRFILSSGVVKLTSGDPSWRNLTALCYHFETQPLPNRIGWYAHHLPVAVQKLSTLGTFFFELAVPFLALGPAPARLAGFLLLIVFQGLIFATGSYSFFNILTMVLIVPLLDDRHFETFAGVAVQQSSATGGSAAQAVDALFLLFLLLNMAQLLRLFYRPGWLSRLLAFPASLMISNSYGLFSVMTTARFEFIIEGSNDLKKWQAYEFAWKPGDPHASPRQAAPHQPRLDWQMWFAALDPRSIEPWLGNLLVRLLQGSRPVLGLLGRNPFPDAPPRYIRLTGYRYRYTTLEARRTEGRWWERTVVTRFQPMTLENEQNTVDKPQD